MDYTINMPSKPNAVKEDGNRGVYEIDGLYAGYGHTLGNSLRRIILSSIPGASVTMIKIDGVPHEFSTISGVKEDVINIILNIKRIRFKLHTDEPQVAKISVKGSRMVTAGDIEVPSQLEIMNKDQQIATLTSKDAKLNVEITVEKGLGYIPRETLHKGKTDVGTIVLDGIFTPVRKVNYEVENMRVGDRTDYNRLRLSIETDGSISPREVVEKSIEIMINHLRAIIGFKEEIIEQEHVSGEEEIEEKKVDNTEILKTRIEDLNVSARIQSALSDAGIRTVGGLVRKKEDDLLNLEGVGKKAAQEIRRALGNLGLVLK